MVPREWQACADAALIQTNVQAYVESAIQGSRDPMLSSYPHRHGQDALFVVISALFYHVRYSKVFDYTSQIYQEAS